VREEPAAKKVAPTKTVRRETVPVVKRVVAATKKAEVERKHDEPEEPKSLFSRGKKSMLDALAWVARKSVGHKYQAGRNGPKPTKQCALQVTRLLKLANVSVPGSAGVTVLVAQLKAKGWKSVSRPVPGAVAYTSFENRARNGTPRTYRHIGLIGPDGTTFINNRAGTLREETVDQIRAHGWNPDVMQYLVPPEAGNS